MGQAAGFGWTRRKSGEVVICHEGRRAATLRGDRAADFLADMNRLDGQSQQDKKMARLTGNYRRGNERLAKAHARNG